MEIKDLNVENSMEGELILEREIDPSRGSTNNSWCHFLARDSLRTDQLAIQRFTSTTKVKGNGAGARVAAAYVPALQLPVPLHKRTYASCDLFTR